MNVVARSLMAAGLMVYAAIHLLQVVSPPEMAPLWLRLAFLTTTVVALVLAFALLSGRPGTTRPWKDGAAALAVASLVALVLAFTVGFLGVTESDIRLSTLGVVIAELVILISWAANRALGPEFDEVDDKVPDVDRKLS